jgi:hypothetical protein
MRTLALLQMKALSYDDFAFEVLLKSEAKPFASKTLRKTAVGEGIVGLLKAAGFLHSRCLMV